MSPKPQFLLPGLLITLLLLGGRAAAQDALPGGEWPAWILELPASIGTVLVADTGSATLYEYTRAADGDFAVAAHYMSIGQRGIGKRRAGDQRTPLGVYFIVDQLDTTRLDARYGITAFPLDYPNTLDRLAGRTGDGIWLHGVPPGDERRPVRDTDGCIALPNDDLAALAERLELNETPVIVVREMRYAEQDALRETARALRLAVESWRAALEAGDAVAYLSLYAGEFAYRGLDRDEWAGFRVRQFAERPPTAVTLEDLVLLEEPEADSIFLARFRLHRQTPAGRQTTIKRLYWRRGEGDGFLIVAEDNG